MAKAKKKAKDLDPKARGKNVKGGAAEDLGRDVKRITSRDVPRVTKVATKAVHDGIKGITR